MNYENDYNFATMNKFQAFRIIGKAMDGANPSNLEEALKVHGMTKEQFEIYKSAAYKVTIPCKEMPEFSEEVALQIHGFEKFGDTTVRLKIEDSSDID